MATSAREQSFVPALELAEGIEGLDPPAWSPADPPPGDDELGSAVDSVLNREAIPAESLSSWLHAQKFHWLIGSVPQSAVNKLLPADLRAVRTG
jgi:hypothetical protein